MVFDNSSLWRSQLVVYVRPCDQFGNQNTHTWQDTAEPTQSVDDEEMVQVFSSVFVSVGARLELCTRTVYLEITRNGHDPGTISVCGNFRSQIICILNPPQYLQQKDKVRTRLAFETGLAGRSAPSGTIAVQPLSKLYIYELIIDIDNSLLLL